MKITLLGAAGGEVTGSAYLLETARATVMVDCGLFQGAKKVENRNRIPQKGVFRALDAVVLTHAHLDHTGRLPLLTKLDYNGPIYATPATKELADLVLCDSAHPRGRTQSARTAAGADWDSLPWRSFTGNRMSRRCDRCTSRWVTTVLPRWRRESRFAPSKRGTCLVPRAWK